MREYPRRLHKGKDDKILVNNEQEEYEAGLKGFERHRNPEVNAREKGTDKEVLRVNPELEKHRLEEEKAKQFNADLLEVAKKAIVEDAKKSLQEEDKEESFQPHNGDNMLNRTEKINKQEDIKIRKNHMSEFYAKEPNEDKIKMIRQKDVIKKPGRKPKVKDGSDS